MKVKEKKEFENKLFSRKEIEIVVETERVPSQTEAKEFIKKEFNTNPNLIRIKRILGKFGSREFTISVDIYNSQEEFNRIVKKTKQELEKEKKEAEEKRKIEEAEKSKQIEKEEKE